MLRAAAGSVAGAAHLAERQANQDAVLLRGHRGGWFLALSDGMGSRPFSGIGSALAVRVAWQHMRQPEAWRDSRVLVKSFYERWLQALPVPAHQAACTLLVATCDRYGSCSLAQIGDGAVVYCSGGQLGIFSPARDGFANETDALGITSSFSAWKLGHVELRHAGDALMLMTDGVSDDLRTETLPGLLDYLHIMVKQRSRRRARRWLEKELAEWPVEMHGDDKSMGLICRTEN